jgi:hypothetical protein
MPRQLFDVYVKDIGDEIVDEFKLSFNSPYLLCFFGIIIRMSIYKRQKLNNIECDYIFDEQGLVGIFASEVFKLLKNESLRQRLDSLPIFRDDKRVLPLQAADLYAWNVRDACTKPSSEDHNLHLKRTLSRLPLIEVIIDERYLGEIRQSLLASARAAPQFLRGSPVGKEQSS